MSAAVLVRLRDGRVVFGGEPISGVPPSITKASGTAGATAMTGYPSQPHGSHT